MPDLVLAAMHLGALHPVERLLILLVAFGPFVVLALVVYVVRRRDVPAERAEPAPDHQPRHDGAGDRY